MSNLVKTSIALFVIGYLAFGYFGIAQAACSYEIKRFDPQGKTTATPADRLSYEVRVERSGDLNDCRKDTNIAYIIEFKSTGGSWRELNRRFDPPSVSGQYSQIVYTYTLNLQTFDRAQLAEQNKIETRLSLYRPSLSGLQLITRSSLWVVSVTGAGGSTGSVNMVIYYIPSKGTYQKDESVKICARLNTSQVRALSISKINYETFVGSNKVGSYSQARSWFETNTPCQDVTVSESNGFVNNANNIRAELWESGTGIKIAGATATLQAQGLTGGSGGGAGGVSLFGCPARDGSGIYACYDTTAKAVAAGCPAPVQKIDPPDKCGCTQADYDAGKCKDGKPVQPGQKPPDGGGKAPDTSLTEVLFNPLPVDSLTGVLLYIMRWFLAIVALWGVTFIVIGGFKLVMAQGNEEAYLAAKKTITWAILGVVVAMLSFSIIAIVQNLIGARVPDRPGGKENPIIKNKP